MPVEPADLSVSQIERAPADGNATGSSFRGRRREKDKPQRHSPLSREPEVSDPTEENSEPQHRIDDLA